MSTHPFPLLPPAPAPAATPRPMMPRDRRDLVLGRDEDGQIVRLPYRALREHMALLGASGSAKSWTALHILQQATHAGFAPWIGDPFFNHAEDGVGNAYLSWLDRSGYLKSRTVHVLSPNVTRHVTGFDPLNNLRGVDLHVASDAVMDAFARSWDENPMERPRMQRILTGVFPALIELGLTLAEALHLLDPADEQGLRHFAILNLKDEYARSVLIDLQAIADSERSRREYRTQIEGPLNRLGLFLRSATLRRMLSSPATIDFVEAAENGDIILADLEPGLHVSAAEARLYGILLTRSVMEAAIRRQRFDKQVIYCLDECPQYLSGDIPRMLTTLRKTSTSLFLIAQYAQQYLDVDPSGAIYHAVLNSTAVKLIGRQNTAEQAVLLAKNIVDLDLEIPVEASIKPTVVGHKITRLSADAVSEMQSESWGESHATSHATTHSTGVSASRSTGTAHSIGESHATSASRSHGVGRSHADSIGRSSSTSDTRSISDTEGSSRSHSLGSSQGRSHALSHSDTASASQARSSTLGHAHADNRTHAQTDAVTDGRSHGWNDSLGFSAAPPEASGSLIGPTFPGFALPSAAQLNPRAPMGAQNFMTTLPGSFGMMPFSMPVAARPDAASVSASVTDNRTHAATHGSSDARGVSDSVSASSGYSDATSHASSRGATVGSSSSDSRSSSVGSSHARTTGLARSDGSGSSVSRSDGTSENFSTSDGETHGVSKTRSISESLSVGTSESWGESEAETSGTFHSTSHGSATTHGSSETFEPIYEDLPGQFHSAENAAYLAGQRIMRLARGQFLLRVYSTVTIVQAPKIDRFVYPAPEFDALIDRVMTASRFSLPVAEVDRLVAERFTALIERIEAAPQRLITKPDAEQPEDPGSWGQPRYPRP